MKNNNIEPLIFIGFMGTGKTTLASYISKNNNLSYVDLDEHIVINEHKTIPQIFECIGEEGFRKLEFKYLKSCLSNYDIISTGGGIIEGDSAFQFLKTQQNVIWLDCELDIIYNRIKNDKNRPNANNKTYMELKNLYSSRISRYNEIAFIKVNSNESLPFLENKIMEEVVCE
ncbi:shikimate kinase [Staphylococcus caeli]|uniref:shikimate kinase n=1 Tax=Staphylococcus caeli TaxID=2201815 RepID=UPI003F578441